MIDKMIGHFEEKNGHKYLVLDDANENKEVSQKLEEVWNGIKKEIETINGSKKLNMGKIFKKLVLFLLKMVNSILNHFQTMLCMSQYENATVPKN